MPTPQAPAEVVHSFALELIASFGPAERLQLLEEALEQLLEEVLVPAGQIEAEAQRLRQEFAELSDALQST